MYKIENIHYPAVLMSAECFCCCEISFGVKIKFFECKLAPRSSPSVNVAINLTPVKCCASNPGFARPFRMECIAIFLKRKRVNKG